MRRSILITLMTLGILLFAAPRAQAAQTGSIRVETAAGEGTAVTLYHAGTPVSSGYRLDEVFGGGLVRWGDLPSEALASWLAEHAGAAGNTKKAKEDGSADFLDLEPGLYLVTLTENARRTDAFVVELPYEDIWQITVRSEENQTQPPPTGQSAAPFLAAAGMLLSGIGLLAVRKKRI
ncbi:MAG: LPXTG cell wall anchor domain-containing protein [Firmicutes bacterium]|nr:LPXTG cell wall anchor domain-containing protein [Bacillota bacterium]